jgi:hypothetical protein
MKKGGIMMASFKRIKETSETIRNIINKTAVQQQTPNPTFDIRILSSYFLRIMDSRDLAFKSFREIFKKRNELYQTLFSLFYISFYSKEIKNNVNIIASLINIMKLVSSEEFFRNYDLLFSLKENFLANGSGSLDLERISILSLYFEQKFQDLSSFAFPSADVSFTISPSGAYSLMFGSVAKTEEEMDLNRILKILYILGLLKNAQTIPASVMIAFRDYFNNQEEGFLNLISSDISLYISAIANLLSSKNSIDRFRRDNDASYSENYLEEINSDLLEMENILPFFSDFSSQSLDLIEKNGYVLNLLSLVKDIETGTRQLLDDVIESIKISDNFVDNYSVFLESQNSNSVSFENIITKIETFITSPGVSSSFTSPFSGNSFNGWYSDLISSDEINGDVFDFFSIFMSLNIRNNFDSTIGSEMLDYFFLRMTKKGRIKQESLSSEFKEKRSEELELLTEKNLEVVENPENEPIMYSIKSIFPELELLDYFSFNEVRNLNSPQETTFRRQIKIIMLEAILKRKKDLNEVLSKLVEVLKDSPKDTLKSLYVEICFRDALEMIVDYSDTVSPVLLEQETIILTSVKELIENFLASNQGVSEDLIEEYLDVWEFFYSEESNLIADSLIAGALKSKLI